MTIQPTRHTIAPLHHPSYGTADWHRLTVLAYANQHGLTEAVRRFNFARQTIIRWRERWHADLER